MAEELAVEIREMRGTLRNRRLRRSGQIPAVLYGHGKENLSLSVPGEKLETVVRRGSRLINLTNAVTELAFIRELQWDTWGTHVLHVDFTRISADEQVEVRVTLALRGEAPGVRDGGVVEQLVHDVEIKCPAGAIPERISININGLKLDESIMLSDLQLPEGAVLLGSTEGAVVHCVTPAAELDEELGEGESVEPEVIGAKPEEETKGD